VLVDGIGLIVGIDRFMSEARALTNFAGNAVATVLIGTWTGEFDRARASRVLAGELPFDAGALADAQVADAEAADAEAADAEAGEPKPKPSPESGSGAGQEPAAVPAQPAAG